jgi:hypothetical protein
MKVDQVIAPFKLIKLFKDNDGNDNVVFLEIIDALVVV